METKNRNLLIGGTVALVAVSALMLKSAGRKIPKGVSPVRPFDVNRYAGKWYEIARLDIKYEIARLDIKQERGLNNTTADYSLNDGAIHVLNRGYDAGREKWKAATAIAKFVNAEDEARLKVSFFGPFYSGYNVIAIDPQYRYAMVAGESLKYLWLLSREATMPENVKHEYLEKARSIGYDTDELVWVEHDRG